MTTDAIRVGFFGKLPSRGDYVRASLSRALVAAWDRWLHPLLPAAREQLGDAWGEVWRATRPWRFDIAPGLLGAHAVSGVWLASTDKVGREFPLTIAAEAFAPCDSFLEAAEAVGLQAIRTAMPPDMLTDRLAFLPRRSAFAPPLGRALACWWRRRESDYETLRADRLPDANLFVRMLTP